eukprot:2751425-Rhodomonas_salina.1
MSRICQREREREREKRREKREERREKREARSEKREARSTHTCQNLHKHKEQTERAGQPEAARGRQEDRQNDKVLQPLTDHAVMAQ